MVESDERQREKWWTVMNGGREEGRGREGWGLLKMEGREGTDDQGGKGGD